MQDHAELLARIATALERMAPPQAASADLGAHPAYVWDGKAPRAVRSIDAPPLHLLRGIDSQSDIVVANVERHALGYEAHDVLLWGARGMGKSALVRASVAEAQHAGLPIGLVQVAAAAVPTLPALFSRLAPVARQFLVFLDDIGFAAADQTLQRDVRSWLDGGVEARPGNVRLAVTANRRAIVPRLAAEQAEALNPRDAIDDSLALADRFGLVVGFHAASQEDYLAIVRGYAEEYGLTLDEGEALEWAKRRGARSGRVARQFVAELAGREGRAL